MTPCALLPARRGRHSAHGSLLLGNSLSIVVRASAGMTTQSELRRTESLSAGSADTGTAGASRFPGVRWARRRTDTAGLRDRRPGSGILRRSEEHTSELQSLMRISYAVFCLQKKQLLNQSK